LTLLVALTNSESVTENNLRYGYNLRGRTRRTSKKIQWQSPDKYVRETASFFAVTNKMPELWHAHTF